MTAQRPQRLFQRSRGEKAFDYVLGFTLLSAFPASMLIALGLPTKLVGLFALLVWGGLLRMVVRAWRDADFRILRISASVLLLFSLTIVFALFQTPMVVD